MSRSRFLFVATVCSATPLYGQTIVVPTHKVVSGAASTTSIQVDTVGGINVFDTVAVLDAPIGALCKLTRVGDSNVFLFGRVTSATKSAISVDIRFKAGTGRWDDWRIDIWDSPVVTPQMFGAAGDGTMDDTAPLRNSWKAADKLDIPVYIPGGHIFRMATASTAYTGRLWLIGAGAIKCDNETAAQMLNITGHVTLDGLTINGNDKCKCFVKASGSTSIVKITNTTFTNFDSTTYLRPVWAEGVDKAFIKSCVFSDLIALENNTLGDENGAVSGILIRNGINFAVIESCVFDNINNRDSNHARTYEDADAINVLSTSNKTTVHVRDCWFNDIGKRAVKFNTVSGSRGLLQDSDVISSWTGTPDTSSESDNGMLEVVGALGGGVDVVNVRLLGGVIQYFASANSDNQTIDYLSIKGCTHTPEPHHFVHQKETTFVVIGKNVKNVTVANCLASGIRHGVVVDSQNQGGHFNLCNNEIQSMWHGFYIANGGSHTITGNIVRQDPYNVSARQNRS
jgi:hypothetical protein